MARQLVRAGHDVTVWNASVQSERWLGGAKVGNSPAEAAKLQNSSLTCWPTDAAVEAPCCLRRRDHDFPRATHISMSTIGVALCNRLAENIARGHHYVAAPVFDVPTRRGGQYLSQRR